MEGTLQAQVRSHCRPGHTAFGWLWRPPGVQGLWPPRGGRSRQPWNRGWAREQGTGGQRNGNP